MVACKTITFQEEEDCPTIVIKEKIKLFFGGVKSQFIRLKNWFGQIPLKQNLNILLVSKGI